MKDGYYVVYSDDFDDSRLIVEVCLGRVFITGSEKIFDVTDFDFGPRPAPLNLTCCALSGSQNSSIGWE